MPYARTILTSGIFLLLALEVAPFPFFADDTGVVSGTVSHVSVRKYPTVVYVEDIPGQPFAAPVSNAVVDQKGKVFVPRVLPVLVGTTVEFLNSDSFKHNVFSPDGEKYDLGNWEKGQRRSYTFKRPGVYTQLCSLHPEMVAYVVVLKTPYFAVADQEGKFRIQNVPAGTWKLKVWNERLKPGMLEKSYDVKVAADQEATVQITF